MVRPRLPRSLGPSVPRSLSAGFSLVELAAVVVILAILAGIAMPRFSGSIARQRVDAASRRVAVDLALARRQARITSGEQTVTFNPGMGFYELEGMQDVEHSGRAYRVQLSRTPYHATLESADFGGKNQVVFDGYGVPESGGTVVVRAGSFIRTITLDGDSGEATIQ